MNLYRNFTMDGVKGKNLEKGRRGEAIAKRYLTKRGYRIIAQNYRTRYSEIDLIVEHKGTLVFVEVRAKQDECFGRPEDTINREKINKLIRGVCAYREQKAFKKECRIDAICIVFGRGESVQRIDHYQNITFW